MCTKILGISAFYHDAAAALIIDGKVVAAAQEERFTRKKHDASFPINAITYCLGVDGRQKPIVLGDLDAIVFYDKPLLKYERLLETYYAFAPKGLRQFLSSMPVWIKEKLFVRRCIKDGLSSIETFDKKKVKILFSEHHLSHAASAFYPSPFEESAILTIDGVGEWATASIAHGSGSQVKILKELNFPHSLGLLYSAFTYFLGFKVNSGEYKLMGLAPYGDPTSSRLKKYIGLINTHLISVKSDGSLWLNQDYFNYSVGLTMVNDRKWKNLFGVSRRQPEAELSQEYADLALAIQNVTEDIVMKMAQEAKRITGASTLCLAGGVALNCVANGKLRRAGMFDDIWIQPAAGDAGGALGAALSAYHMYFGKERKKTDAVDDMHGAYLGPAYADGDIEKMIHQYGAVFEKYDDDVLFDAVAEMLASGNVIGWHQGRMEWGPRALGNRSILGDPRNPEMQKRLNLKIKYRESFRPFAPSVLAEDAKDYFDSGYASPYMLLIDYIRNDRQKPLPEGYHGVSLRQKLYTERSDMPAITHLDFSARVQTVHKDTNPRYYALIKAFKEKTGCGVLINTSFNVRGEPIVCAPVDSYRCFMRTEMDYLVVGNYVLDKKKQPTWHEKNSWKEQSVLD